MSDPAKQQRLAALRASIANLEQRPALTQMRDRLVAEDDTFPRPSGGLLQEVYTDAVRNGGASLAFALGQAKGLLMARRVAVLYLQLSSDAQFFGLPYGPGLSSFGFDPTQLVIVRAADMTELLWAAEEALACQAVAGIIADIGGDPVPLDFTASRRLSLRTVESGVSLFLLRYGSDREASAAHLRWHLSPHRSGRKPHDGHAPGAARWRVQLEKGVTNKQQVDWLLEWRENGFATIPAWTSANKGSRAAVPGAVPAQLADRLSLSA